jgi:hypothetical protein
MTHGLRAILVATMALACSANERGDTPRLATDSVQVPSRKPRVSPSAPADSAVYRSVARVDSLPYGGEPGDAGSLVIFSDSTTLHVPIREAKLLLELPVPGRASWLLLSGVECWDCDANIALWPFRAVPGRQTPRPVGFVYPGEATEAGLEEAGLENTPHFRSRLFLGQCVDARTVSAVWLEEVLRPDSARTRRVRILEASPTLSDRVLPWTGAFEARVFTHVAAGRCREVPPLDQIVV